MVHGRNQERAYSVAEELQTIGGTVEVALGDLTDPDEAGSVAQKAQAWRVQILVNNAGPFSEHDWITTDPQAWATSYDGNVVTVVRMVQALLPTMLATGWGRIITLGSRAATTPQANLVDYSAAKAAVLNLTSSLAQHLAGTGITANTISPGVILTEGLLQMFDERARLLGWDRDQTSQAMADYAPNPVGRLGTGDDIAAAVAYLASPLASYVTGTELRVDGGITPVP